VSRFNVPHRWLILLGAGLLMLGLLSLLVRDTTPDDDSGPALRASSNRPRGARALMIWLTELGYRPRTIAYRAFDVDPSTRALFVLRPTYVFADHEIEQIGRWVERGGVLLIVDDGDNALLNYFDAGVQRRGSVAVQTATPLQPLFLNPPVETVTVSRASTISTRDPTWIPVLGIDGSNEQPVAAMRSVGNGRVYVIADPYPVSNAGIGEADNAAVILNILAGLPRGSVIAFDEYHQGLTEHGTLSARLVREPWGWAIIYAAALIFLYLALSGRRFGRAATPAPIATLRSRAEYVATISGLLRRGQHLGWLRQQYASQVKRSLGSRYRVRADQPARPFIEALRARNPNAADLATALEQLESSGELDEQATITLMREVDTMQKRMTGSR
jgi:hypothetical protein